MIRNLLKESKRFLINTPSFIKLVFLVSFGRLVYVIILIGYNVNNILIYRFDKGLSIFSTLKYFWEEITANNIVRLIVILGILILIGYGFLYPTGISASINFLNDKKQKIGKAIGKGVNDFFVMFELNALAFSFGFYTYIITLLRLVSLDILGNGFAIGLIIIWGIMVLFASIFWQYAKFILILENRDGNNVGVFESIKKSIGLTINNIGITFRARIFQAIIISIFYFKTFIIISIPLLLMYFLINSTFVDTGNNRVLRLLGIITLIFTIYILSIIQAFLKKFWFDIYKYVSTKKDD